MTLPRLHPTLHFGFPIACRSPHHPSPDNSSVNSLIHQSTNPAAFSVEAAAWLYKDFEKLLTRYSPPIHLNHDLSAGVAGFAQFLRFAGFLYGGGFFVGRRLDEGIAPIRFRPFYNL